MKDCTEQANCCGTPNTPMQKYIGTKVIFADPMDECTFLRTVKGHDTSNRETMPGYKVVYPDGYVSWSPQNAFDEAYRPTDGMSFGLAIDAMRKGFKVARKGWNGKGIHIELQRPDEFSKMTHPYIFIDTTGLQTDNPHAPKNRVPWLASQTDMLAEDWMIID